MQDETLSQPLPLPRPRRSLATTLLVALVAFVLGGALVGWLIQSDQLPFEFPGQGAQAPAPAHLAQPAAPASSALDAPDAATLGTVETRLALLEDRLTRIDGQAGAAAGNAARAEALLIAYAARRRLDKGEPLGVIESQLKLRFGGAQPQAVDTILAAARRPVTLDELVGRLDAAGPSLTGTEPDESSWSRLGRELASLFVVRRAPVTAATPAVRVGNARLMLVRGEIDKAIAEIERLPGADRAHGWIESARHYAETQRALDVIETAAMLEPRALRDSSGKPVQQPSPLTPTDEAAATPTL
jgi:hypothetical protein